MAAGLHTPRGPALGLGRELDLGVVPNWGLELAQVPDLEAEEQILVLQQVPVVLSTWQVELEHPAAQDLVAAGRHLPAHPAGSSSLGIALTLEVWASGCPRVPAGGASVLQGATEVASGLQVCPEGAPDQLVGDCTPAAVEEDGMRPWESYSNCHWAHRRAETWRYSKWAAC